MDVHAKVTIFDVFRDDKYPAIRGTGKTQEQHDIRMACLSEGIVSEALGSQNVDLLHESPLSLEVLGDIIILGRQDLLDRNIYAQVHAYTAC